MNKVIKFIQKERLYLLLLTFVILLNAAGSMPYGAGKSKAKGVKAKVEAKKIDEDLFVKKEEMEKILNANKDLAVICNLSSLLIFLVLILGIAVDAALLSIVKSGRPLDIRTYSFGAIRWNTWDVMKVVILFLFFGYMLIITESFLKRLIPLLKNDNLRMIINSSILDVLTIVLILYFTLGQYGEKLAALGISLKNFVKNVFYGIVGYVAAVPILVAILIATAIFINMIKYVPEKQLVVELFLKEKDAGFLIYTSLFAAIGGPIIEELFFRGFMYNAFKKHVNKVFAMFVTAALFAALHTHPVGFLPIMVLGIILAYLYEKTGTLVSSMTVHMIHNLTMVGFVFLAKSMRV